MDEHPRAQEFIHAVMVGCIAATADMSVSRPLSLASSLTKSLYTDDVTLSPVALEVAERDEFFNAMVSPLHLLICCFGYGFAILCSRVKIFVVGQKII